MSDSVIRFPDAPQHQVPHHRVPALFISAPASHHGKTTVTAALARYHTLRGLRVRVFKTGPDFLDPMLLALAAGGGHPAYQLDLWMAGEEACRKMVWDAAQDADLILIEGVMGLFDGQPSSADLAVLLGVPILAVIDATGMAQTFGAVAYGLAHFRKDVPFAGVLANAVASARHAEMLQEGLRPDLNIPYFGALLRGKDFALPERHLGLVQAAEVVDLYARLDRAAEGIGNTKLADLPPAVTFERSQVDDLLPTLTTPLCGVRIGIAQDAAFSFLYPANLDCLREMGATLHFFSPLSDHSLPDVDSLYFPGGYPELHLQSLQDNPSMKAALREHHANDKPIFAECGGMLYLLESLTDKAGKRANMVGLLRGHAIMQGRLQGLGYQSAAMPGGVLRAHTFHHSVIETEMIPIARGERLHNTSAGEKIFQQGHLVASYLHCYFPSNPVAAAQLFLP
ncbi:cobyrinate a,c-diamide synthase [Glaciimonas sp. CA11.2]|uniref:cobyrinate a,c-diamide synthase n=1 Tax=Glaciimonas sp. CA11.2 TaxID=3048601 RepID=UPI002AB4CF8E|nr:cobyrinate a,c-diamide synthase [Glaciimonas sp. CA11.2]MDY7546180.1 cobyrinate a,c-diamide synthase [Glaciimonas sp. CA11.2]MEB0161602.1 cobyrinate a,c-diamide synthase [Glaciimonas sp. CA11.2]